MTRIVAGKGGNAVTHSHQRERDFIWTVIPDDLCHMISGNDTTEAHMTLCFENGMENKKGQLHHSRTHKYPPFSTAHDLHSLRRDGNRKTELAREYAHQQRDNIDAIFWVLADGCESLNAAFTKIAVDLQLSGADSTGDPTHNLHLAHEWFHVSSRSWLLIPDNVEKFSVIEKYLPDGGQGSVIMTTRDMGQPKLFRGRRAFMPTIKNIQAEDLITKFSDRYKIHMRKLAEKDAGTKRHTLATLWDVMFATVRERPSGWTMLGILSCLEPHGIPKQLFLPKDSSITVGPLEFCKNEIDVDEEIDFLKRLGFVEKRDDILSLQRSVQVAFLSQLDACERHTGFNAASALVNHGFSKQLKAQVLEDNCVKD
ncbi:hypothetical protein QBC44DRAFT_395474 [Cladorrhinum sp. PSN332]|nr:hypothetical protein QBC44DRAFT_395474 [Cladorrhinum sp. PSN332]